MAKFCGNCGAMLNETAIFCGGCGNKISAGPSAPPATEWATVAPGSGMDVPLTAAIPSVAGFANPVAAVDPVTPVTPASFAPVSVASIPPQPVVPAAAPAGAPVMVQPPVAANAGYTPVAGAVGATPTPYAQIPGTYPAAQAAAQPVMAYPAAKKSNLLLKLVIAFVLIIFIGGSLALAGIWYAAQKIRAKVHAVASQVLDDGDSSSSSGLGGLLRNGGAQDNGNNGITGDPCRFLSKAEVGQAVGLPILRTEAQDSGCSYIAKGDPADVTAKHLSSMLKGMGADDRTQQVAQKLAGGLFAQQQATDKDLSADAQKGEIPVLTLIFTAGHASAEMKANRAGLGHIGATDPSGGDLGSGHANLAGIGDEAYSAAGSMILLRKGNVMARMMYVSCPCNTENIKPLAQTLASRL